MNEAETRAEYIDPALKAAGWGMVEGSRIRREYPITPGRIEGLGRRMKLGRLRADWAHLVITLVVVLAAGCGGGEPDASSQNNGTSDQAEAETAVDTGAQAEVQPAQAGQATESPASQANAAPAGSDSLTATQTFLCARKALDRALEDPTWSALPTTRADYTDLPPAVILDIDGTILDISEYEAELIQSGAEASDATWDDWVYQARGSVIPGALEFCRYAADEKVALCYVTDRLERHVGSTQALLEDLGFPIIVGPPSIFPRTDSADKSERFQNLASRYRVLLLIGDSLHDFLPESEVATEQRDALVDRHQEKWGDRWFALPNLVDGDWEQASQGDHRELDCEEALVRLRDQPGD